MPGREREGEGGMGLVCKNKLEKIEASIKQMYPNNKQEFFNTWLQATKELPLPTDKIKEQYWKKYLELHPDGESKAKEELICKVGEKSFLKISPQEIVDANEEALVPIVKGTSQQLPPFLTSHQAEMLRMESMKMIPRVYCQCFFRYSSLSCVDADYETRANAYAVVHIKNVE